MTPTTNKETTELVTQLKAIAVRPVGTFLDREANSREADEALLKYIADPQVTEAYEVIRKNYGP